MFQKKENQVDTVKKNSSLVDTIIGESASLKGNLITGSNIRIDGQFEGELIAQGEVIIGKHGFVNGNMVGDHIMIYGEVHGNIISNGLLEIAASGKLYGDAQVESIKIDAGATMQGRINMKGATEILDCVEEEMEMSSAS